MDKKAADARRKLKAVYAEIEKWVDGKTTSDLVALNRIARASGYFDEEPSDA